ncbi:MAG TPA: hypothetical protein VF657_01160, partial [Actinoplanes sp.]
QFAAEQALTVVPAVPERDLGPEVRLSPDVVNLSGFLKLAATLGGGVLYLDATRFEPDGGHVADPPADLVARRGQLGEMTVAFAANGLVHFWRERADWYQRWKELADAPGLRLFLDEPGDRDVPDHPSEEERARLAGELIAVLLADPAFRASKPGGARQRYAKFAIPADTHRWVIWDATRDACARAEELSRMQYEQIAERLDDLADELLGTAEYRQASSPGARRQVAEQFLAARADGFAPPAHVRDELYARTQRLAKTAGRPPVLI